MAERKDTRFKPGQSGNPKGRPPGARNRATMAAQELLDGEVEGLTRKVIQMALDGDAVALRLCLERIVPPRRDRPVEFRLPPMRSAEDAVQATAALIEAVANGDLTPMEATDLGKLVESYTKALELSDIARRLDRLEQQAAGGGGAQP